jgi:hypothetical protein
MLKACFAFNAESVAQRSQRPLDSIDRRIGIEMTKTEMQAANKALANKVLATESNDSTESAPAESAPAEATEAKKRGAKKLTTADIRASIARPLTPVSASFGVYVISEYDAVNIAIEQAGIELAAIEGEHSIEQVQHSIARAALSIGRMLWNRAPVRDGWESSIQKKTAADKMSEYEWKLIFATWSDEDKADYNDSPERVQNKMRALALIAAGK